MEKNLSKLQQRFSQCLNQTRFSARDLKPLAIRESKKFKSKDRFEVYHYAYFARIHESLGEDFPLLVKKLGEKKFEKMIRNYLQIYPPQHNSLAEEGRDLHRMFKEPELRDLAKLEWLRNESEWAEGAKDFDWNTLGLAKDFSKIVFYLHPATRLFQDKRKTCYLIYRVGVQSEIKNISVEEFKILKAIQKKEPVSKIMKRVPKLTEERLYFFFFSWVSQHVLSHFK